MREGPGKGVREVGTGERSEGVREGQREGRWDGGSESAP